MKTGLRKIWTVVTIVMFAYYIGANSLYVHTHNLKQGRVTHSHPFNPHGHHTHDATSLNLINANNITSIGTTPTTVTDHVEHPALNYHFLNIHPIQSTWDAGDIASNTLRAPPVVV
ncbi:MAG: hypothetical protein J6C44_07185 [Muribaculaceae bacterium]|nr:hypothetical protein [Muribaculaceae bacterium]